MSRSQERLLAREGFDSSGRGVRRTVFPTISGTPTVGQVLTGTNGTFTGFPGAPSITRQWLRNGAPISGATGATYTLVAADAATRITFQNVAVGNGARVVAASAPTASIAP